MHEDMRFVICETFVRMHMKLVTFEHLISEYVRNLYVYNMFELSHSTFGWNLQRNDLLTLCCILMGELSHASIKFILYGTMWAPSKYPVNWNQLRRFTGVNEAVSVRNIFFFTKTGDLFWTSK